MRRAARLSLALAAGSLPMLAFGCVPQNKYDNLLTANRSLQEQIVGVEEERDESREGLRSAQEQLAQVRSSYDSLQGRYGTLESSFDELDRNNDEYLNRIARLQIGPLPAELESALEDLARAHPEVLTFDARRGMLRFASDFTFDLGSTALKDDAMTTLTALARILNEPVASSLEARVMGHTDNVPIRRAETLRQHPTNMHLSVHRSIAVRDALVNAGVDAVRIQVAGYGPYRPVVANGARGAAENRRVEIYLAAMPKIDETQRATAQEGAMEPTAAASTPEPMK